MTNPRGLASAGVKVDEQAATSSLTLRDATDQGAGPRCELCDGPYEVAYEGVRWCARCVAALLAGLDRRRAAELRLPPLDRAGAS
jgi:hypothetical protein